MHFRRLLEGGSDEEDEHDYSSDNEHNDEYDERNVLGLGGVGVGWIEFLLIPKFLKFVVF
jgi:hypothetical protein